MADACSAFYDIAEYFASEELSDLTLVLAVSPEDQEDQQPPVKRQRRAEEPEQGTPDAAAAQANHMEQLLPGHSLVLAGCSPVFKAELTRWKRQGGEQQSNRPRITLRLDSTAELEAARTMVQFMYQQRLPNGASQPLLMTLLHVADRFQVQTCTAACAAALSGQELTAATLDQVLRLPPVHCDSPLFSGVFKRASDQLQQQYGDLEAAWADRDTTDAFRQLPLKGVELVLGDERTKVAYENTVLRAASVWVREYGDSVTAEERRRLAQLIRVPQLTPFFGSGVAMVLPWLTEALGVGTLANGLGIAQAMRGIGAPQLQAIMHLRSDFGWPDSWALGSRPQSARKEAFVEWKLLLKQLEDIFTAKDENHLVGSDWTKFGGYDWCVRLSYEPSEDAAGGTLGVYLHAKLRWTHDVPESAQAPVMVAAGSISCLRADLGLPLGVNFGKRDPPLEAYSSSGWGERDFWGTGPLLEWDAARFADWTDANGQLTLQCRVSDIL